MSHAAMNHVDHSVLTQEDAKELAFAGEIARGVRQELLNLKGLCETLGALRDAENHDALAPQAVGRAACALGDMIDGIISGVEQMECTFMAVYRKWLRGQEG